MNKALFLLMLCLPALAQAQAFKCRLPSGQVSISSTPCQDGSKTVVVVPAEVIPEARRQQAQEEQQQRLRQIEALDAQRRQESEAALGASQSRRHGEAIRACVADVERADVSESARAELIAGCQEAGASQEKRQVDAGLVRECVANVERQEGEGYDKARAIATCHGAVVPERQRAPVVVQQPVRRPLVPHQGPHTRPPVSVCIGSGCERDEVTPPRSTTHRSLSPTPGRLDPAGRPGDSPLEQRRRDTRD